jgi:hypothetical protein
MSYDPSTDLQQMQSDILTEDTSSNTLMPYDPLAFLNKALTTDSTNVISALNDLQTLVNGLFDNFTNFGNKYNGLLLDTDSSAGQAKLQEMQNLTGFSTILESIVELAKRNNGTSSSGVISNFSLDSNNILTLTLSDNSTYTVDLSSLSNSTSNMEWGSF